VRTDPAGNIKPDKEKSTERIDGAVAVIMALDRAIRNGGNLATSVYDEREILVLLTMIIKRLVVNITSFTTMFVL